MKKKLISTLLIALFGFISYKKVIEYKDEAYFALPDKGLYIGEVEYSGGDSLTFLLEKRSESNSVQILRFEKSAEWEKLNLHPKASDDLESMNPIVLCENNLSCKLELASTGSQKKEGIAFSGDGRIGKWSLKPIYINPSISKEIISSTNQRTSLLSQLSILKYQNQQLKKDSSKKKFIDSNISAQEVSLTQNRSPRGIKLNLIKDIIHLEEAKITSTLNPVHVVKIKKNLHVTPEDEGVYENAVAVSKIYAEITSERSRIRKLKAKLAALKSSSNSRSRGNIWDLLWGSDE